MKDVRLLEKVRELVPYPERGGWVLCWGLSGEGERHWRPLCQCTNEKGTGVTSTDKVSSVPMWPVHAINGEFSPFSWVSILKLREHVSHP